MVLHDRVVLIKPFVQNSLVDRLDRLVKDVFVVHILKIGNIFVLLFAAEYESMCLCSLKEVINHHIIPHQKAKVISTDYGYFLKSKRS